MSAPRLTPAQRRHLSEMVTADGQTRFWRPYGSAEMACAAALRGKGLLEGTAITYNDSYWLSPLGLEVAKELAAAASPSPETDRTPTEGPTR